MKYPTLLLFGAPGTGKGTWGKVLGGVPGFHHLSSGDLFRSLNASSRIGALSMSYILRGELVPDDVTVDLWREHMDGLNQSGRFNPQKALLLLDGLPRNRRQAELLKDDLEVKLILSLVCSDRQVLLSRLRRRAAIEHRHDDTNEETIRRRFEVYEQQSADMLAWYPKSLIAEIDVVTSVVQILHQISSVLASRLVEGPPA
ncbi:MAG: nucleoside monophosphate kinase [Planctomycetes bacterium]|nr:nucleoside monophosphate kinase [Planctomycetota bacterium]